jgi:hypothetical protein
MQFRVLVQFDADRPQAFLPFSSDAFQPLAAGDSSHWVAADQRANSR